MNDRNEKEKRKALTHDSTATSLMCYQPLLDGLSFYRFFTFIVALITWFVFFATAWQVVIKCAMERSKAIRNKRVARRSRPFIF
jgi:ABC-type uncharacterized transport system permease subunit